MSFEATIKLIGGETIKGILTYLPNKHYRFNAINNPNIGFEFHRMTIVGDISQLFVDSHVKGFKVYDNYMEQLEVQISINDLPSE